MDTLPVFTRCGYPLYKPDPDGDIGIAGRTHDTPFQETGPAHEQRKGSRSSLSSVVGFWNIRKDYQLFRQSLVQKPRVN